MKIRLGRSTLAIVAITGSLILVAGATAGKSSPTAAIPAAPPVPTCHASSSFGCFMPAPPEPGTAIPTEPVSLALRPAADNSFYLIPSKLGMFKDVGITINPPPYGIKATFENAIPLLLSNQANVTAMDSLNGPLTMKTTSDLKMIMLTDDFAGTLMFANPKLHLTPVSTYLKQGMPLAAALKKALAPIVSSGQNIVTSPQIGTRPLIETAFGIAGDKIPKFTLVDDPEALVLAGSGKADFLVPVNAGTAAQLLAQGWTDIAGIADLTNAAKTPAEKAAVEPLVLSVGLAGNRGWVESNPNTVLRLESALFRAIDTVVADKGKSGGVLSGAVSFINSYTGSSLTTQSLYKTYSYLDPFTPWKDQGVYFTDKSNALYYQTAVQAFLNSEVKQKLLPAGLVPDDSIWAGQIYSTLVWYQNETNTILSGLAKKSLSPAQKSLVASAMKYEKWYDFLDSFRFARAAAAS